MNKKMLLLVSFCLFWAGFSTAQAASTFNGTVYESNGDAVADLACEAIITSQNDGADTDTATISTVDGTFSLSVAGDDSYYLSFNNCSIAGDAVYPNPHFLYLTDGETVSWPYFVDIPDRVATIRGKIVNNEAAPLAEQYVCLYSNEAEASSITSCDTTDSTGRFNFSVAPGNYSFIASASSAYCETEEGESSTCLGFIDQNVDMAADEVVDLGTLSYTAADSGITLYLYKQDAEGVLTLMDLSRASLEAHTDSGVYYSSTSLNYGYTSDLYLTDAENWVISVAGIEDNSMYYGLITVPAGTTATDIVLTELYNLETGDFEAVEETFAASEAKEYSFANGTTVSIPAYALDDEGEVTIIIEPAFDLYGTKMPLNGFVYNFTAYDHNNSTISTFAKPISVEMAYDEADLATYGIEEGTLQPSYYDEDYNRWLNIPHYTLDTENNTLSFAITHFSQYSTVIDVNQDLTSTNTDGNGRARVRARPAKATEVRIKDVTAFESENYKELRASWKKVTGADYYDYALYKKKAGGWQLLSTNSATVTAKLRKLKRFHANFYDTFLTDRKYGLKVRAVKNYTNHITLYGRWSKMKTFTPIVSE